MDELTYTIKITSLEENVKKQNQKIEDLEYKVKKIQKKIEKNKNKKHKCDFCNKIYNGYTSKDFPFIYYESDENKFILSSEYQGHGSTKYLNDINFCPKCGRDLHKR